MVVAYPQLPTDMSVLPTSTHSKYFYCLYFPQPVLIHTSGDKSPLIARVSLLWHDDLIMATGPDEAAPQEQEARLTRVEQDLSTAVGILQDLPSTVLFEVGVATFMAMRDLNRRHANGEFSGKAKHAAGLEQYNRLQAQLRMITSVMGSGDAEWEIATEAAIRLDQTERNSEPNTS